MFFPGPVKIAALLGASQSPIDEGKARVHSLPGLGAGGK